MIETRLYLYDSTKEKDGYRGIDLSKYLMVGDKDTDILNEELYSASLTLQGYPVREEFAPSTKFIYEKWENGLLVKSDHIVVENDLVDQPVISDNEYFVHHIDFLEPSVVAQGRVVDNISVTYKLQDVRLDTTPEIKDPNTPRNALMADINLDDYSTIKGGIEIGQITQADGRVTKTFMRQPLYFTWEMTRGAYDFWKNDQYYNKQETAKVVSVPLPSLVLGYYEQYSVAHRIGDCSFDIKIVETNLVTGAENTIVDKQIDVGMGKKAEWESNYKQPISFYPSAVIPPNLSAGFVYADLVGKEFFCKRLAKFVDQPETSVSFTQQPDCKYNFYCTLHNFSSNGNDSFADIGSNKYYNGLMPYYNRIEYEKSFWNSELKQKRREQLFTNGNNISINMEYVTYKSGSWEWVSHSAPPVNAYQLFVKAQLATQVLPKTAGVAWIDTPLTFYVSNADKTLLLSTPIIESFFHQKNLWEVFIDIGKYIHSIPKIVFGEDDRFLVTWQRLGSTNVMQDKANRVSIFNSRKIDNYTSACSSYINNAIQLGDKGTITEYVYPKTSSEDFTISNNTAEIKVSKPIIELIDMEVVASKDIVIGQVAPSVPTFTIPKGTTKSLMASIESPNGYIFAKQIYDLLPANKHTIDVGSIVMLDKSRAIYYTPSTNVISGLNYRAPAVNTGDADTDLAIKNILAILYGVENIKQARELKVNDFYFKITYRAKDNLRSEQSRPDLRHYLLNSKYDLVPQHKQFNNQEDILVDTSKLGNNVYGKLIKTGNTSYHILEWVASVADLKHSGDLYLIENNWYYVYKVTNTYYADHIISEVEFSKDYNQLSEIIGIPSEPRFYEISEQSSIKRDICFNQYLVLGTEQQRHSDYTYHWRSWTYISQLLFLAQYGETRDPKFVCTAFKFDGDSTSSPLQYSTDNVRVVISPLNVYNLHNTLTMEWDMVDNFSAGDKIITPTIPFTGTSDDAYRVLQPVRYKDTYGRADLVDFLITDERAITEFSAEEIADFPEISTTNLSFLFDERAIVASCLGNSTEMLSNYSGLITAIDNREVFKGNFNVQMITDSDRFVLSSYLWDRDKGHLSIAFLNKEVNKIASGTIPTDTIINIYSIDVDSVTYFDNGFKIKLPTPISYEDVKAIAIVDTAKKPTDFNSTFFVMARNVDGLTASEKTADWYISQVAKDFFSKQ